MKEQWLDSELLPARRAPVRTYRLEHANGQPIRVERTILTFSWRVVLPDGTVWEDIQARDVKECRAKLAAQIGRLPSGTRCARIREKGFKRVQ